MLDKNIINANIKLQDMNKILEKENKEIKELLYSIYNYLKAYDEIEEEEFHHITITDIPKRVSDNDIDNAIKTIYNKVRELEKKGE